MAEEVQDRLSKLKAQWTAILEEHYSEAAKSLSHKLLEYFGMAISVVASDLVGGEGCDDGKCSCERAVNRTRALRLFALTLYCETLTHRDGDSIEDAKAEVELLVDLRRETERVTQERMAMFQKGLMDAMSRAAVIVPKAFDEDPTPEPIN